MKHLFFIFILFTTNIHAASWVYSENKDKMTETLFYTAKIQQPDLMANFSCSARLGKEMGIYVNNSNADLQAGIHTLRIRIDEKELHTSKVHLYIKNNIKYFNLPKKYLKRSIEDLENGKTLRFEIVDDINYTFYKEVSLKNSGAALKKANARCAEYKNKTISSNYDFAPSKNKSTSIDTIKDIIITRTTANWIRPMSTKNNMHAYIRIQLFKDGTVASADILQSSGNNAFDQSAIKAALKIEPIKEVKEMNYKKIKYVDIKFDPQATRW